MYFFNYTAATELYPLSLHDALPISVRGPERPRSAPHRPHLPRGPGDGEVEADQGAPAGQTRGDLHRAHGRAVHRSEEHTSELQSQSNFVCRLLLDKNIKLTISHESS